MGEPGAASVVLAGLNEDHVQAQIRRPGRRSGSDAAGADDQNLTGQLCGIVLFRSGCRICGYDQIQVAPVHTGAALDALIRIDLVEAVLNIDGSCGTFQLAVVTADTALLDIIRHVFPPIVFKPAVRSRGLPAHRCIPTCLLYLAPLALTTIKIKTPRSICDGTRSPDSLQLQ